MGVETLKIGGAFMNDCMVNASSSLTRAPLLTPQPVTLSLPYPPSANRYWRSFVPKGGSRAIVTLSADAHAFKQEVRIRCVQARISKPLTGRIAVMFQLYPGRPKDWAKRSQKDADNWDSSIMCIDLGNCEKVACDALNGLAWKDDKQIRRMLLIRERPDDHGARLAVTFGEIPYVPFSPSLFDAELF